MVRVRLKQQGRAETPTAQSHSQKAALCNKALGSSKRCRHSRIPPLPKEENTTPSEITVDAGWRRVCTEHGTHSTLTAPQPIYMLRAERKLSPLLHDAAAAVQKANPGRGRRASSMGLTNHHMPSDTHPCASTNTRTRTQKPTSAAPNRTKESRPPQHRGRAPEGGPA